MQNIYLLTHIVDGWEDGGRKGIPHLSVSETREQNPFYVKIRRYSQYLLVLDCMCSACPGFELTTSDVRQGSPTTLRYHHLVRDVSTKIK